MKNIILLIALTIQIQSIYSQEAMQESPPVSPWAKVGTFSFLVNQSSFDNWIAGGVSNISGAIGVNYDFNYSKANWSWDNKIIVAFGITNILFAQDVNEDILNWYNGTGAGMHTEKAYKKLKKRKSKTVIVAIIDSGIDIEHEDLKGKIWTNTDEIPENGIDDDSNGYIDDVHGWNFLGNSNGDNANSMRLERTRILAKLSVKFDDVDETALDSDEKAEYA